MTLSVSTQVSPVGSKLISETSAGATPNNNVTGASGSLFMVDIDNALNSAPSYLKIYNSASPVVGTAAPDLIFAVGASIRRSFVLPEGWDFSSLSFACVTAGGTTGTISPASAVAVLMVTS